MVSQRAARLAAEAPAGAGFSVWADLGGWLAAAAFTDEQALWRYLWEATRVNILPGGTFGCPGPGWFRLCHATDPALVREGITRLGRQLAALAPPRCLDPVPAPRSAPDAWGRGA